jgi:hypothetical protein
MPMPMPLRAASLVVVALGLAASTRARAEGARVHWDLGGQVGALQRLRRDLPEGESLPTLGPSAELQAHVAVLPMFRAGVYATFDASRATGAGRPWREYVGGGLRFKVTPPLLRRPFRAWVYAGIGGEWAVQPSFTVPGAMPASAGGNVVAGAQGGILELPFGVGFGWAPWEASSSWLIAEAGARAALLEGGTLYDSSVCLCRRPFDGKESFAVGLSVGVSWGQ